MKIYIIGSGGVGGYLGAVLAKNRNDVTFLARGEHYRAIKKNGIKIESTEGAFKICPAQVIDNVSDIACPDLVIFAVKTYDTDVVARELSKVVNKDTVVITFQNGIDGDEQIKRYIRNTNVYPGVAYVLSTRISPGVINQINKSPRLIFGSKSVFGVPELKRIKEIMCEAKIDAVVSDNIVKDLWDKFILITSFISVTAIRRKPINKVFTNLSKRSLFRECINESIKIAKAEKIDITDDMSGVIMSRFCEISPSAKPSLFMDVDKEHKSEIEKLNGTLIKLAKKHNINVPINQLAYKTIKSKNRFLF